MKIDVLGINIDALTKEELLHKLKNELILSKPIFITTPYSEMIVAAQRDKKFKDILNSADFALPDGIGVLWAAHYLSTSPASGTLPRPGEGKRRDRTVFKLISSLFSIIIFDPKSIRNPIPEKISGAEFVWDLAELASQKNYSVFLLGGYADTPNLAAEALKSKYPDLKIAGTSNFSPPARGGDDEGVGEVVQMINDSRTDFLFVALGPGSQEKWIYRNLPNLRIKLAIGLGGTFDYLAKKRPYRPQNWARRGLEWLWRLLTQPRRIGRILKGVLGLIWYCFRAKM